MPLKQLYNSPQIQRISLDNEISLILISGNPGNPAPHVQGIVPEYFNTNPVTDGVA